MSEEEEICRDSKSSHWSGLDVRRRGCYLRCRPHHLAMVPNYEVRCQKPSSGEIVKKDLKMGQLCCALYAQNCGFDLDPVTGLYRDFHEMSSWDSLGPEWQFFPDNSRRERVYAN
ncbi:hypothetical protein TNCV_2089801 [Trichonephila clavipes]|nr:hypothetical protein TNCV_2089801 [Trichonephila clavipes]